MLEYLFGAATVAVGWSGYFGRPAGRPRDPHPDRVHLGAAPILHAPPDVDWNAVTACAHAGWNADRSLCQSARDGRSCS